MTLVLQTKSGEQIDAGYYKGFMKLSRIGKYAFETRDLCGLIQNLAENPRLREARLFGYDEKKVWELEEGYNSSLMQRRVSYLFGQDTGELEKFVNNNRELSAEEKIEMMKDKIEVPVRVHRFRGFLDIGDYEIGNSQFVQFAYYILNGGFDSWAGELPKFAKDAKIAIQLSGNTLFKSWYA